MSNKAILNPTLLRLGKHYDLVKKTYSDFRSTHPELGEEATVLASIMYVLKQIDKKKRHYRAVDIAHALMVLRGQLLIEKLAEIGAWEMDYDEKDDYGLPSAKNLKPNMGYEIGEVMAPFYADYAGAPYDYAEYIEG